MFFITVLYRKLQIKIIDMEVCGIEVIIIFLLTFIWLILMYKVSSEPFQRLSYRDVHDIIEKRYESGKDVAHPIQPPLEIDYPQFPVHPLRPKSFKKPEDLAYPSHTRNLIVNQSHTYANNPVLYGYLKSEDDMDNELYELYELYDYRRGRNGYAYKDSKYQDNRESMFVSINHKSYNGDVLYTGDVISLGYNNKSFVVQEYEYKNRGSGTRYKESDIRDEMEGYGILRPLGDANNHDSVREEDRFFILYRQEVDRRRGTFYYYVKDRRDVLIQFDKKKYKDLQNGDTVDIPGKEKYGKYVLSVYDDFW
jgi:hypothetical protein